MNTFDVTRRRIDAAEFNGYIQRVNDCVVQEFSGFPYPEIAENITTVTFLATAFKILI